MNLVLLWILVICLLLLLLKLLEALPDLDSNLVLEHVVVLDLNRERLRCVRNSYRLDLALLHDDLLLLRLDLALHVLSAELEVFDVFVGLVPLNTELEHLKAIDDLVATDALHVRDASVHA